MNEPIAYTYEADYHCKACTIARFTTEEGDEVGAVFGWDEWFEPSDPNVQVLACGDCGAELARTEGPYDEEEEVLEPLARGFCDNYEVHEPHVYRALNQNMYDCDGLTEAQLAELDAYDPGTCEHGLSADLCGGPMHWYD